MDRKALIDKLATQLQQWDTEIEKLESKAQKAGADARAEYKKQLQVLHGKKETAQVKLDEVRQAGEDAWEELRLGAEAAFDDMKNALKTAWSRFK